jgi:hypothetical protein
MSSQQKWWYVVFEGRSPGIYANWELCRAQVHKYPDAVYRKFASSPEAEKAYLNYKLATSPDEVQPTIQACMVDPHLPPPLAATVHHPLLADTVHHPPLALPHMVQHQPLMYFIFGFLFAVVFQFLIKWL